MRTFSQILLLDHHFDADPVMSPSYTIKYFKSGTTRRSAW